MDVGVRSSTRERLTGLRIFLDVQRNISTTEVSGSTNHNKPEKSFDGILHLLSHHRPCHVRRLRDGDRLRCRCCRSEERYCFLFFVDSQLYSGHTSVYWVMQGVTEEQRRRMEANRLNALRRLEERKASWSSSNTTDFSSSQPTVDTMETSSQTTLPPTHSNVSAWDLMLSSSSSLSRVAKKSSSSDPTKTLGEDSRTADKKDVHKKRTKVNVEIQPPKTVVVSFSFSKELHEFMKTLRGTYGTGPGPTSPACLMLF